MKAALVLQRDTNALQIKAGLARVPQKQSNGNATSGKDNVSDDTYGYTNCTTFPYVM